MELDTSIMNSNAIIHDRADIYLLYIRIMNACMISNTQ